MIDEQTVQQILDRTDIVEVISDFVSLKKAGTNMKGFSPFSSEKTPSFFVSPAKQIFKCFSSGLGGSAVTFLMEHEKMNYPEVLRYLAEKYNIEIEEKEQTPEEKEQKNRRESLMIVTDYAQKKFDEYLHKHEEGIAVGLSYFKKRGFRPDIVRKFGLGYCPDLRSIFSDEALKAGYQMDYLSGTGLTIDKGNYHFDRFQGRVMFPIHNLSGRAIAFGGRTLKSDKTIAKYLNSPESEIYHKSDVLYGIYLAKNAIVKEDRCYMVEGYTDAVSLHQAGIENVVASSGTALTANQVRLVKRFTPNLTILYDGDPAGIKASLRGIDIVLEEGMNVKVMLLPDGEDPDSFAQKHSSTELREYIEANEQDFMAFKAKLLMEEAKSDPVKRAKMITEIVSSIAIIPNAVMRTVYVQESSKLLDISEEVLLAEVVKLRDQKAEKDYTKHRNDEKRRKRIEGGASDQNNNRPGSSAKPALSSGYSGPPSDFPEPIPPEFEEIPPDAYVTGSVDKGLVRAAQQNPCEPLERELVRLLVIYGQEQLWEADDEHPAKTVAQFITEEILHDDLHFKSPLLLKVFELFENDPQLSQKDLVNMPDQEVCSFVADLLVSGYELSKIFERDGAIINKDELDLKLGVPKMVLDYKDRRVRLLLDEVQVQLKETADPEKMMELLAEFKAYKEVSMAITKQIGARTILAK